MKPRVLFVGDSIRIGYVPHVRERVGEDAVLLEIPENGGDSSRVAAKIERWVAATGPEPLDVVHLNCGLHDIRRPLDSGENQQPLDVYAANLRRILSTLRRITPATVVWATTTPVIEDRHREVKRFVRLNADIDTYNAVALAIMRDEEIPVNDLHRVVLEAGTDDCLSGDGVHMTDVGNAHLADAVTAYLRRLF